MYKNDRVCLPSPQISIDPPSFASATFRQRAAGAFPAASPRTFGSEDVVESRDSHCHAMVAHVCEIESFAK